MHLQIPQAFNELFLPKRYKIYYGGRGGAKSWAFAIALLVIGMQRKIQVLCARELQISIADSVHKLLSNVITANEGFSSFYEVQNKAILGKNGTEFAFRGLKHNINEIKSFEGADYVWVEEAQAVSDRSWETLIPTIRKEGSEIWIGFNPKNPTDPTWQRFVQRKRDNAVIKKVGWQDNPFFPKVLEDERLDLFETDPEAYLHIWEGEFDTRYSGAVYAKWVKQDQLSDKVKHDPNFPVYTAWDLGFDDATAIVFYQVGHGEIFIIDYYESNQEDTQHYCEILYGRKIVIDSMNLETKDIEDWHFGDDLPEHANRKEYYYEDHNVPHDANYKIQAAGGRSIVEQAWRFGVKMSVWQSTTQQNSQEALRQTLPRCWVNSNDCSDLIHALLHYHYEYDEDRKVYKKEPVHDWSSHGCDAAEIMARAWKEKVFTMKEAKSRDLETEFFRKRQEHKLEKRDPYRIKRLKS